MDITGKKRRANGCLRIRETGLLDDHIELHQFPDPVHPGLFTHKKCEVAIRMRPPPGAAAVRSQCVDLHRSGFAAVLQIHCLPLIQRFIIIPILVQPLTQPQLRPSSGC